MTLKAGTADNTKAARGQLNMYLLLKLLSDEAALVEVNLLLLRESAVIRRQQRGARTTTAKLFKLCSFIYKPD